MTRFLLFTFLLFLGTSLSAQTILRGTVKDDTGEPLPFANVSYDKDGNINGTSTDLDGNYSVQLEPGTYTVTFSYAGYQSTAITGVIVSAGRATKLDGTLSQGVQLDLGVVVVAKYEAPLIDQEGSSGQSFTSSQIEKLSGKSVSAIVGNVAGISTVDDGSAINVKGARSNSTVFFLDDVRIRGPLPPQTEIDQINVMTGGIDAKYGDTGGGIISVISKGPSRNYTANLEVETSEYLDPYGYNLAYLNLAGPIISKREDGIKKSILGFRLSGQYRLRKDDRPSIVPIYVASQNSKDLAEENPIFLRNGSPTPIGEEFTTIGAEGEEGVDVWSLDYQPDEEEQTINLTGKLDAKVTKNLQLTLTGTYYDSKDKFTPFGWQFMNSHNNPTFLDSRLRGIFRIHHKLGNWGAAQENQKKGLFQNMSYTLLFSYEQRDYSQEDARFGDRLFEYGHAGVFDYEFQPTFGLDSIAHVGSVEVSPGLYLSNNGYVENFLGYTPSEANPGLSAYNNVYANGDLPLDDFLINAVRINGVARHPSDDIWGGLSVSSSPLFKNANQVYNTYGYGGQNLYSGQANISFDLNSRRAGVHSINLGFQYEQREDKAYTLRPQDLWRIANNATLGLQGVDYDNIIYSSGDTVIVINNVSYPVINVAQYGRVVDEGFDDNKLFFKAIRDKFNVPYFQEFNLGGVSPKALSLDMFAGSELIGEHDPNGSRVLDYFGYDFLGNPVDNTVTFKDFFTSTDDNGNKNYPVAPSRPIYMGGYIQDKFIYDDMIFKLGVRVDRYDANTKVFKDKYGIFLPLDKAADFASRENVALPGSIGDDFAVYLDGNDVIAYRDDDQWYFSNGEKASDGNVIFGGQVTDPVFEGGVEPISIQDDAYDPDKAFVDFEPEWTISPRMSFSFPISDDANFFAHYDIYSQRPTSNTIMTPLDYYNFVNDGGYKSNPDLKPQRTVDYAVGFQQRVSKTSSIKLTAFYQELRNLIQLREINYVPIIQKYTTYDNIDFATTKGFTFEYDLRRTKNTSLFLTYTMKFVNGTGSNANSSGGSNVGNVRYVYPLSYDERHRIQAVLDYRYGEEEGPRIFGRYLLQNFGVNLLTSIYSGRPYTAKAFPGIYEGSVTKGALNGARKPWSFSMGVRADKDITFIRPNDGKRGLFGNLYFRVENLLNTANIVSVYQATGSPYDDGYLNSERGFAQLESIEASGGNVDSYTSYYQWGLENPDYFVLPRRMYLGLIIDF